MLRATAVVLCLGAVVKEPQIVLEAFARGDFVPHVITDQSFVARYGVGAVRVTDAGMDRFYFDADCGVWLVASIDTDAEPQYRMVQELMVTSIPISEVKHLIKGEVCASGLKGIALGDSKDRVLNHFSGARIESITTTSHEVLVEELIVRALEDDSALYYRVLVANNKVVGIGLGVTE